MNQGASEGIHAVAVAMAVMATSGAQKATNMCRGGVQISKCKDVQTSTGDSTNEYEQV